MRSPPPNVNRRVSLSQQSSLKRVFDLSPQLNMLRPDGISYTFHWAGPSGIETKIPRGKHLTGQAETTESQSFCAKSLTPVK